MIDGGEKKETVIRNVIGTEILRKIAHARTRNNSLKRNGRAVHL